MTFRAAALPALVAVLVSGVLGVQLANGGGDFSPLRPANPCSVHAVTSVSPGIFESVAALGREETLKRLKTAAQRLADA